MAMFRLTALSLLLVALVSQAAKPKGQAGGSKACSHTGFYSKKVVPLCEKHFPDEASKNAWVVQFYHPYVKKNADIKAAYEALADEPDKIGGAKIGAVDCQQNGEFCAKHGIREAPTTRVFRHGSSKDFSGEHSLEALQKFVKDAAERFQAMEDGLNCQFKGVFKDSKKDTATPLCISSFPPPTTKLPWLISFYESGNVNKDKTMRTTMNKLGEKYGNSPPKKAADSKKTLRMRVGAVECSDQGGCDKLGISSLPAVRFYREGAEPQDFDSFFDREEVQTWADARLKEIPKPEKIEVLKADMPVPEGSASTEPQEEL